MAWLRIYLKEMPIDTSRTSSIYHGSLESAKRRTKTCLIVLIEMVLVAEKGVTIIEDELTSGHKQNVFLFLHHSHTLKQIQSRMRKYV